MDVDYEAGGKALGQRIGGELSGEVGIVIGEHVQRADAGRRLERLDAVRRQRGPYRQFVELMSRECGLDAFRYAQLVGRIMQADCGTI